MNLRKIFNTTLVLYILFPLVFWIYGFSLNVMAVNLDSSKICRMALNGFQINNCDWHAWVNTKNLQLCNDIPGDDSLNKSSCYRHVANELKDEKICDLIVPTGQIGDQYKNCHDDFNFKKNDQGINN